MPGRNMRTARLGKSSAEARRIFKFSASPGCMLSLILHLVIVVGLLLLTLPKRSNPIVEVLSAPEDELIEPVETVKLDANAAPLFGGVETPGYGRASKDAIRQMATVNGYLAALN